MYLYNKIYCRIICEDTFEYPFLATYTLTFTFTFTTSAETFTCILCVNLQPIICNFSKATKINIYFIITFRPNFGLSPHSAHSDHWVQSMLTSSPTHSSPIRIDQLFIGKSRFLCFTAFSLMLCLNCSFLVMFVLKLQLDLQFRPWIDRLPCSSDSWTQSGALLHFLYLDEYLSQLFSGCMWKSSKVCIR